MEIDPSTGLGEPLRPVRDGSLITSPLDSTAPFPPVKKPVLISTVLNEAGYTVYSQFPQPLPTSMLSPVLSATLGPNRTDIILASDFYPPVPSGPNGTVDARDQLESIGTDYMWRCPSWTFARAWRENGGTPYVALYHVGASYPGNSVVSYCKQAGNICHQDEIELVVSLVFSIRNLHPDISFDSSVQFQTLVLHKPRSSTRYKSVTGHSFIMEILM